MADRQISIKKLFDLFREVGGNLNDCSKEKSMDYKIQDTNKYKDWKNNLSLRKHLEKAGIYSDNIPTSYVAIDFEKLYTDPLGACSVGMTKYINGEIVDRYFTYIRPPFEYLEEIKATPIWKSKNGGITKEMVIKAPTFAEILPVMTNFIDGLPLVAHSESVERNCICKASEYYGVDCQIDYEHIIDTCPLSIAVEKQNGYEIEGKNTHTLDIVCHRFGVAELRHHHADDDAEMCGNLLLELRSILRREHEFIPIMDIPSVSETPNKYGNDEDKYYPEDMHPREDLDNITDNPFKGKVVCISAIDRSVSREYGHTLHELGAILKNEVSKKTSWLICGDPTSCYRKVNKTIEAGGTILAEDEYLKIIDALL